MLLALAWRIGWAITTTALNMIACNAEGHPGAQWRNGVRSCKCGRRWPA